MAKVDLELVKMVLQRAELDAHQVAQIIEDINFEAKAKEADDEKEPPVKKQFVVIVSDPHGKFTDMDYTGWVVQIPADQSEYTVEERIFDAACEYNRSKKGRRDPAKTLGEACERVPAKIFRERKIWVKNKEAAYLLATSNALPSASELRPREE